MRRYVTAVVSMFAVLLPVISAQAQSGHAGVLFVLDGSGSMWGQIDNQAKITIAKDVMKNLITNLADDVAIGLQVYGHRKKGDCDDIEIMVPLGGADKKTLTDRIDGISPKGKTPITKSLEIAGEQLKALEEETTIVLISDGKETCEGDPCAMVSALREAGVQVQIHVVGFDVGAEERQQLRCIAEAGGGRYFSAETASQLSDALIEVQQEIETRQEAAEVAPAPKPEPEVAKVEQQEPGLKLSTILNDGGDLLTEGLAYQILAAQADEKGKRKRIAHSYDAQPEFKLPAGAYLVEVKYGAVKLSIDVEIPEARLLERTINLNAGYLRLNSIFSEQGEAIEEELAYSVLSDKADLKGKRKRITHSYDATPLFVLPAGKYQVQVKHGSALANIDVEVRPGEISEQQINLNVGYLRVGSVASEGGEAIDDSISYNVFSAKKNLQGKRKRITHSYDPKALFKLPAGKYTVQAKVGTATTAIDVEVSAGALTEQAFNLNVGYLRLSSVAGEGGGEIKKGLTYQVLNAKQNLQGKHKRIGHSYDANPLFKLAAGKYRIEVKYGNEIVAEEVDVKAGELSEVVLKVQPQ